MKSKLTPELQEQIIKRLKIGFYAKEACQAVGIHRATYYRWIERGEKALELKEKGKEIPKEEEIYCDFCDTTRQADAEGELNIFLEIRAQVKKDWHAGMEILSRKYPDRWGKKDKTVLETEKPLDVRMSDIGDKLKKKVNEIAKRLNEIRKDSNK